MKRKLVLVASPPACGKTFVSELLANLLEPCAYLDKDDLAPLLRRSFELQGQELNMDGAFYLKNLHSAEYETILRIALSALRFENTVILNAPFCREVRDCDYMRRLKERVNAYNADLILIWVVAPVEICYKRMKQRNSDRDALKLENWNAYIKTVDYSAPLTLKKENAVDTLIVFDTTNDETTQTALLRTLKIIKGA